MPKHTERQCDAANSFFAAFGGKLKRPERGIEATVAPIVVDSVASAKFLTESTLREIEGRGLKPLETASKISSAVVSIGKFLKALKEDQRKQKKQQKEKRRQKEDQKKQKEDQRKELQMTSALLDDLVSNLQRAVRECEGHYFGPEPNLKDDPTADFCDTLVHPFLSRRVVEFVKLELTKRKTETAAVLKNLGPESKSLLEPEARGLLISQPSRDLIQQLFLLDLAATRTFYSTDKCGLISEHAVGDKYPYFSMTLGADFARATISAYPREMGIAKEDKAVLMEFFLEEQLEPLFLPFFDSSTAVYVMSLFESLFGMLLDNGDNAWGKLDKLADKFSPEMLFTLKVLFCNREGCNLRGRWDHGVFPISGNPQIAIYAMHLLVLACHEVRSRAQPLQSIGLELMYLPAFLQPLVDHVDSATEDIKFVLSMSIWRHQEDFSVQLAAVIRAFSGKQYVMVLFMICPLLENFLRKFLPVTKRYEIWDALIANQKLMDGILKELASSNLINCTLMRCLQELLCEAKIRDKVLHFKKPIRNNQVAAIAKAAVYCFLLLVNEGSTDLGSEALNMALKLEELPSLYRTYVTSKLQVQATLIDPMGEKIQEVALPTEVERCLKAVEDIFAFIKRTGKNGDLVNVILLLLVQTTDGERMKAIKNQICWLPDQTKKWQQDTESDGVKALRKLAQEN